MLTTIDAQDLIPEYWHLYVPTERSLLDLGRRNIGRLKNFWRSSERAFNTRVKEIQKQIDLLTGKSLEDIKRLAEGYEHPDFPKVGVPDGSLYNNVEPLDEASAERRPSATTWNFCGWCKNAGGGICNHGYYITTYCTLLPGEFNWRDGDGVLHFNTPCIIANGKPELLKICIDGLNERKADAMVKKAKAGMFAAYLAEKEKEVPEKPCFAAHRPDDYFILGEKVWCQVPEFPGVIPEIVGTFVYGKIVSTHSGMDIMTNTLIHTNRPGNGFELHYQDKYSPEILHDWEFKNLKDDPEYLQLWLKNARQENSSFDVEKFLIALQAKK